LLSGSFYGTDGFGRLFHLGFPLALCWFHAKWLKVVHFIGVAAEKRDGKTVVPSEEKTAIRVSDRTIKKQRIMSGA
jgi:hypothetical protein